MEKWRIKMLQLKGVSPTFWQDDQKSFKLLWQTNPEKILSLEYGYCLIRNLQSFYERQNGKHFEIKMTKRSQIQYIIVNRFWQIQCISFTFITDNSTLKKKEKKRKKKLTSKGM